LGEIVVTKEEESAPGFSSGLEVSASEIEIRNAQTVEQALDFIPGVRLTVGEKNEPYLTIRGFNQDKILVLLDGIPIASPYYGYVDLSQIPAESIAKIKVTKSASSVLYGANALGGVVNIITKKAAETRFLEFYNGLSDNLVHNHYINYADRAGDFSFWLSGSHRESDGFELSKKFNRQRNEDGNRRENSDYENSAVSFKMGHKGLGNTGISLFFNYIDNEKGVPPSVSSNKPRFRRFTEWRRWIVALASESTLNDDLSVKTRLFYDKYDNTLKSYDDLTYTTQLLGSAWTSIYDEYAVGASIYLDYALGNAHDLKGAFNFKQDVHREQADVDEPWQRYEFRTYSLGLEDSFKITDKVSLRTGVSFDFLDQADADNAGTADTTDSFNPVAVLNFSPCAGTELHTSVAGKTRFPTMHELFSQTSGNPNLKEQTNLNWEVGLRHEFNENTGFSLSYFYNKVEDLIERASKNDPYLNISRTIFEGIESGIYAGIAESFLIKLGHTFIDAYDKDPYFLGYSDKEFPFTPRHKVDLELDYLTDFGLRCNVLGAYHGERFYYDSGGTQHKLGGYFLWNMKLSQTFLENWQASLHIENIFDRNYQEEEGFPLPGRTFRLSLKATF